MGDYLVIVAYDNLPTETLLNTFSYEKALKLYKQVKRQRPLYVGVVQECGDKLVQKVGKWRRRKSRAI